MCESQPSKEHVHASPRKSATRANISHLRPNGLETTWLQRCSTDAVKPDMRSQKIKSLGLCILRPSFSLSRIVPFKDNLAFVACGAQRRPVITSIYI